MFPESFSEIFFSIAFIVDLIALAFVLFATISLIHSFLKMPKIKKSFSLTDKNYHKIRSAFVHRVILSLDFFIAADLIKLAFLTSTDALLQVLIIVIIRTILSFFLFKELRGK